MKKEHIIKACEDLVLSRIQRLQMEIAELRAAGAEDTKNSSGDKHETGRAMTHLEMEKLGAQMLVEQRLLADLRLLRTTPSSTVIAQGSLVHTSAGIFLVGAAVGKVHISPEEGTVFGISAASPLGSQLIGKSEGEEVMLKGTRYLVGGVE